MTVAAVAKIFSYFARILHFHNLIMFLYFKLCSHHDRQEVHEVIREHSQEAARRIKEEGKNNELISMLSVDPRIGLTRKEINNIVDGDIKDFVGMAPQQVEEFVSRVDFILDYEKDLLGLKSKVEV